MKNVKLITNLWVVIPTYNRADDLLECVKSLLEANIVTQQIVVVDNNSQDETLQKINDLHSEIILISLEKNLGATGASNIGFDYALKNGAEYVLRLDSDTIVAPDFAEPLLKTAIVDENIGIVAPKIYYFDPPDEIWYAGADAHPFHFGAHNDYRHQKDSPENNQIREVDYTWGAAMLIKSELLINTGGFDTDFFVYYEEVDFCLRVKKMGYRLFCVPESHVWHKVGSTANNNWTAFHWNRSKMLLYRKHAQNLGHLLLLIAYAFLYAIHSCFVQNGGNRGPLYVGLKGLIHGFLRIKMPSNKLHPKKI